VPALNAIPVFVLVFFRVAGLMLGAPLFSSANIPKRVKILLAIVLAYGLSLSIPPVKLPQSVWLLATGIAGELLFGWAIGMALSFVFIAVNWAGEIIGQQLGINLGEVFDPQYGKGSSIISDMYFMLALVIFLIVGGHRQMIMGLRESFDALPLLSVGVDQNLFNLLLDLLHAATLLAMQMAAPMLLTMLVVDLALGFVGKTMPQLNVLSAGIALKSMIGISVLLASLTLTSDTIRNSLLESLNTVRSVWNTRSYG
jgi:flagellar biosynthetic protein FliR